MGNENRHFPITEVWQALDPFDWGSLYVDICTASSHRCTHSWRIKHQSPQAQNGPYTRFFKITSFAINLPTMILRSRWNEEDGIGASALGLSLLLAEQRRKAAALLE